MTDKRKNLVGSINVMRAVLEGASISPTLLRSSLKILLDKQPSAILKECARQHKLLRIVCPKCGWNDCPEYHG